MHFTESQTFCQCFCGWKGEDWRNPPKERHWEDNVPMDDDIGIPVFSGDYWDVDY